MPSRGANRRFRHTSRATRRSWFDLVRTISLPPSLFLRFSLSTSSADLLHSFFHDSLLSLLAKVTQLEALTKQRGIVVAWTDLPSTSGMVGKVFVVEARAGTKSAVGRGSRLDIAKEAAATSLLQSGALDRAGDDESKRVLVVHSVFSSRRAEELTTRFLIPNRRPESPPAAEVPASKILEPERVVGLPSEEEGEGEGADAVSTTTS